MQGFSLKLNPKQKEIAQSISNRALKYFLLYGGSRSGKSVFIFYYILVASIKYPGSKHLVARYSFANAKKTVWLQTMLPLLRPLETAGACEINITQGIVTFFNGSIIVLGGLKPDQINAVLGSEYATIWVNEANENVWSVIELLFSRLNDTSVDENGIPIRVRFFSDLNPTSKKSWDHKFFIEKINPDESERHKEADKIFAARLSPLDNKENLSDDYIETLEGMSEHKKLRFFYGEYGHYEGLVYNLPEDQRELPKEFSPDRHICGLDFGRTHPNVFSVIGLDEDRFGIIEEDYVVGTTIPRILRTAQELHEKYDFDVIYADGSRPEIIEQLVAKGLPAQPAFKNPGSVLEGILYLTGLIEEKNFYMDKTSAPMHNAEFDSYRWDEKDETKEKPLKIDDHCMDALRYGIYTYALEYGLIGNIDELADFQKNI